MTPTPTPSSSPPLGEPSARGGWWHEYVCPVHHVELLGPDGDQHRCRHGCEFTAEPWASAWRALELQRDARRFRALTAAAAGGDGAAADLALTWMDDIGARFASIEVEHAGAQEWMVPGRLFHQALSESIWAAAVASGVWTLADCLPGYRLTRLRDAAVPLLTDLNEAAVTARARTELRSNYVAWFNAAGALTSGALARLGAPVPDQEWLTGPAGLHAHVRAAILDDGWEWEGATYYHAFVLLAYLLTLRGTDPAQLPADVSDRILGMVEVLAAIATRDGVLPALHDSPYRAAAADEAIASQHERTEAFELAELAVLVPQFVRTTALDPLAAWCRQVLADDEDASLLAGLNGWFAGAPRTVTPRPDGASALFREAGYAVLRPAAGDWQAVLDFGPHGGSHGHLDKLALYLYGAGVAWQPDFGIVPYGSRLRRDVYRTTMAHPAFSVDHEEQQECAGRLERWSNAAGRTTAVVAAADEAFPGVEARRHLVVLEAGWDGSTSQPAGALLDVLELRAERPRALTAHLRPAVPVTVVTRPGGWLSSWGGRTPLAAAHACSTAAELSFIPGWSPASDPAAANRWLDWTATAAAAVFATLWLPGPPPVSLPEPHVTSDAVSIQGSDRGAPLRYHLTTGELT